MKLTCVNWPSHLETAVAEGLSNQPLNSIAEKIVSMGFNCVRLTWPLYLATDESFSDFMTVRQSLRKFGLFEAVSGFQVHNPTILDLPLIKAFQVIKIKTFLPFSEFSRKDFDFFLLLGILEFLSSL